MNKTLTDRLKSCSQMQFLLSFLTILEIVSLGYNIKYEVKSGKDKDISGFDIYSNRVDMFRSIVMISIFIWLYVMVGRLC